MLTEIQTRPTTCTINKVAKRSADSPQDFEPREVFGQY
jgi:hypothetical protein